MAISLKQHKHTASRVRSRLRRQTRGRKNITGTADRPRLVVTRTSRHITAQVVDDTLGKTLVHASTMESELRSKSGDKTDKAKLVGGLCAEGAKTAAIEGVVFDRPGNQYHGRVAALADGAREGGLTF